MDVFDLYAKLSLDSSGYDRALNDAAANGSTFATKFAMTAKLVGSTFVDIGKGVAGVVDKAVDAYGDYEQLVGGVETLFGKSSDQVMKYAENAYKTAGLSANEYMDTVTSFSASLLQSLNGDTSKAADYADMAIRDMSDNANKMGTDMSSIQNAYQGFAKQNYTMLDNLKLGYGGTKEEMERLVKDAEKLDKSFKAQRNSNGNLTLSYADVVDAIHIVQSEMQISGITAEEASRLVAEGLLTEEEAYQKLGTTAKEAATTIQGSKKSMESAWKNMITSLVTGGDFFDDSLKAVTETTKTYAQNLVPAIEGAMHGFSALVSSLAPVLSQELPGFVSEVLPDFINAITDIINGILTALPGLLQALEGVAPMVSNALVNLIPNLISFILTGIPDLIETGIVLLRSLIAGFASNIDTIVPQLTQGLIDMVDQIGEIIDSNSLDMAAAATALLSHLADALIAAVPSVLTQTTQLLQDLTQKISEAADGGGFSFLSTAESIMTRLVNSLSESIPTLIPELTSAMTSLITEFVGLASSTTVDFANSGISIVNKLITSLSEAIPQVMTDITTAVTAIADAIIDTITGLDVNTFLNAAETLVSSLADGIVQSVGVVTEKLPELITKITDWLGAEGNLQSIIDSAVNITQSLASGISDAAGKIIDVLPGLIEQILNWFTGEGNLSSLVEGAASIVITIADEIPGLVSKITEKLPELITGMVDWLIDPANLTNLAGAAIEIFGTIVSDSVQIVASLATGLGEIVSGISDYFSEHKDELLKGAKDAFDSMGTKVSEAWTQKIKPAFDKLGETDIVQSAKTIGTNLITNIVAGIDEMISDISTAASNIGTEITNSINSIVNSAKSWGTDMIQNFVDGITQKWEELKDKVSGVAQTVKNFLGFSEPKEGPLSNFHTYAPDMMELFAKGIRDNEKMLTDTVADAFDFSNTIRGATTEVPVGSAVNSTAGEFGGWTINVYGAEGMDEMTLARLVADQVRDQVVSIGAAA